MANTRDECEMFQEGQREMRKRAIRAAIDVLFPSKISEAGAVEAALRRLEIECICTEKDA